LALYLIGSGISAFIWALTFTTAGWVVGRTTRALGWHPRIHELPFMIVLVLIGVLALLVARRRHVEDRTVEVLEAD